MALQCRKLLGRVKKSVQRHSRKKLSRRLDLLLFRQQRLAKKLLQGLAAGSSVPPSRRSLQIYRPVNPVYEVFIGHRDQSWVMNVNRCRNQRLCSRAPLPFCARLTEQKSIAR